MKCSLYGKIDSFWQDERKLRTLTLTLALVLAFLNFIRIFDMNFWGDEAFTCNITVLPFSEMISKTAADVHPPLYYVIVYALIHLFGTSGAVYHLASLIPYLLTIAIAVTYICKEHGVESTLFLILFSSLLRSSVRYNVEVRMYSWAQFFVLLAFLFLHRVFKCGKARDYALFSIFSVGAAYTHYYALISVAFFYVEILIYAIFMNHKALKKAFATCVLTVIAYLPWLAILLSALGRTAASYWITSYPGTFLSLFYLFDLPWWFKLFSLTFLTLFLVATPISMLYEAKILQIRKDGKAIIAKFNPTESEGSPFTLWAFGGLAAIFGTIVTGIYASWCIRPVFLVRYVYPVSAVAWILFGSAVSKLKAKRLVATLVIAMMLSSGLANYATTYFIEAESNSRLIATLREMKDDLNRDEATLFSSNDHMSWSIASHYFPKAMVVRTDISDIENLEKGRDYYFLAEKAFGDREYGILKERGITATEVYAHGNIGEHDVWIYKLE